MFRIHLYEQRGDDWKGRLSLTDNRHTIIRDLTHPFASLENIPRAIKELLKKAQHDFHKKQGKKERKQFLKNAGVEVRAKVFQYV
jgi:hypothetical protein